jgi:NitT/TauT family transport system permease protein
MTDTAAPITNPGARPDPEPTPEARPGRPRRLTPARVIDGLLSVAVAVGLLALAEYAANRDWVSPLILPNPSSVWNALVDGFDRGIYWPHVRSTVFSTLAGFFSAACAAVLIGGTLAAIPRLERIFYPFIVAFQTMPKVAIAPVIILWLGFGTQSKVVIIATICFFPILVNTLQGLRIRDQERLELFRSLGATRWQLFRYLRFPDALPYVFAGLNIGIVFALIGTVVAEFLGSRDGLGVLMVQQQAAFNVAGMFAALVLLMVVGMILNGVTRLVERKVVFWAADLSATSR